MPRLGALIGALVIVAAALTVACGGSDTKSASNASASTAATVTPAAAAPPQSFTLTATEAGNQYGFDPTTFSLKTGAVTIHYLNKQGNSRPHTLEIKTPDGTSIIKSDEVDPGKATDVTFTLPAAGTYQFICYNPGHAARGQSGTFAVAASEVAAAPAPASSSSSGSGDGFFSRHNITLISLLFHIPAITLWVGLAMFDFFVMFTPGFAPDQRTRLLSRFKWVSVGLITIIMITGIWQTLDNPFHRVTSYNTLEELRNNYTYGEALFIKHIFVIGTFGISLLVRFFLAPRAEVALVEGDGAAVASQTKLLTWMTVLNLAMTLAAVVAASRMTIELH